MISNGEAAMEAALTVQKAASQGLKKGPWTAAEDAILIEYVKKHGEGNWNSVQKNSGLMRCGKSCRLRWANHLRPNLKKGSFTPEEERIIIELHAKLGNKWARMASQLPGRTDNEIKNFWNTRMKRRQRAGLPVYPQEYQEETTAFRMQHHHQHQEEQKHPNNNPSSSSFSSLLSSSRKASYNPSLTLLDPINFSPALDPLHNNLTPFYSNPALQFKSFPDNNTNNSGLALPMSPYGRLPSSITVFNQTFPARAIPMTPPSLHYNTADFETNMSFTSLIMGAQVEPVDPIPGLKSELSSGQTPPRPNTPFSSNTRGGICVREESSKNTDNDSETAVPEMMHDNSNSGLLDALLLESQNLSRKEKLIGMKPSEEPMDEMNSMDDDLLSLLDNFPTSTPLPEWYRSTNIANGLSSSPAGEGRRIEVEQEASLARGTTADETPNVEWAFGSSYWNNMPGIC
ncbi:hypothetical protein GH714_017185 [Hevea brasiliensis]|uniref:Uncharacterized protein n=1 Tax=Hevea brasiliensis TaxID=3981 RepID=A0A6A6KT98_HEVBR|nr:hypothetical protein GH714_017185 [Hevea brasiliensis]